MRQNALPAVEEVNPEDDFQLLRETRKIIADLFDPKPWVYWTDLLLVSVAGWTCFVFSAYLPWSHPIGLLALAAGGLALYRELGFNHDLSHIHGHWTRNFSIVWNTLLGIPFFQPTSMYGASHMEHHSTKIYAGEQDPRYVPVGRGPRSGWVIPLLVHTWIVPIALAARFFITGPISLIKGGAFRENIIKHASTLKMNLKHVRRLPNRRLAKIAVIQELACLAIWGSLIGLGIAGILPVKFFVSFYLVYVVLMALHYIRSLCLHRYARIGDGNLSLAEIIEDSVSFNRPAVFVELICPTNSCYHSLHHLFPTLPYHNLPKAHERLLKALDPKHPYIVSFVPSMVTVMKQLWAKCKENEEVLRPGYHDH
jgi:fatty acid desaturase